MGIIVWLELTFLLSVSGGGSTFNNIFDDSEDDDLLDATESPSSKQESAVFSALKTMVLFGGAMIASAVILGKIFIILAQYFYKVKHGSSNSTSKSSLKNLSNEKKHTIFLDNRHFRLSILDSLYLAGRRSISKQSDC